jgi:hypothetical protein
VHLVCPLSSFLSFPFFLPSHSSPTEEKKEENNQKNTMDRRNQQHHFDCDEEEEEEEYAAESSPASSSDDSSLDDDASSSFSDELADYEARDYDSAASSGQECHQTDTDTDEMADFINDEEEVVEVAVVVVVVVVDKEDEEPNPASAAAEYMPRSFWNVIIASNEAWVVPPGSNARRYFPLGRPSTTESDAYF